MYNIKLAIAFNHNQITDTCIYHNISLVVLLLKFRRNAVEIIQEVATVCSGCRHTVPRRLAAGPLKAAGSWCLSEAQEL